MSSQERTIIIIDKKMELSPQDFMLIWNVESSEKDLPVASLLEPEKTFDASLMTIVGDVANVIQIVTFIGVPTVAAIVGKILKARAKSKPSQDEGQEPHNFEIDETIIDLGRDGKVQRITIRHAAG